MEPISNVGHLVETLRKQLAESQQKTGTTSSSGTAQAAAGAVARPGIEELQRRVRQKLQHIDPDDPKSLHKSIHIFLESVLLWEFGESLMGDPKFHALLDDVQRSMEADPHTQSQLTALVEQLR